ncbi:LOW QUALITY PROTEIN: ribonuclease P protein subunit p38 [Hyla sarda]|uniref:LOW QUALITY PROTEIN: ribonuclease P protein subunit p38 n=1 Tax=Hyla sarda TaxID=327740 RepID=UPI0024C3CA66|nr:LOW QUALITY PROTEIN: ribonuclease P protein subunit p38 [Hyla sarda]
MVSTQTPQCLSGVVSIKGYARDLSENGRLYLSLGWETGSPNCGLPNGAKLQLSTTTWLSGHAGSCSFATVGGDHHPVANMAAKIAKGAIRKSKPIASKTCLSSPYEKIWSPVVRDDMHFILQTLLEKFKQLELKRIQIRTKGKKSKKGKNGEKEEAETPKEEAQVPSWTHADLRKQLAIGINEVTRALERNDLSLVIVCKSAKPDIITKHIIELSHSRDVPACQLPRLSENVAPALGLTSVLALGFRRSSEVFRVQVEAIAPRVPPLHVPWLQAAGGKDQEVGDLEEEPQEEMEDGGGGHHNPLQKRKLSPGAPQHGDVKLQELKVKKIVPNPNKKRKVKKSKKATAAAAQK